MNPGIAVSTCLKKFATFTGTASRSEYWYFLLFYLIFELVVERLGALRLLVIVLWIPLTAVGARRMHDVGKSGWWLLCPIVNIVFLCTPTALYDNRYASEEASGRRD